MEIQDSNQTPELVEAVEPNPAQQSSEPAVTQPAVEAPKQKIGEPRPKTGVAPELNPAAQPQFTPNYKFKAHGKEYDVPELLRGVMKDKDSEKYVHDLFEKAYGLGPIKERFQETRQRLQQVETTHQSVMSQIGEAREAYKRNDLDTMFEIFQVPQEKILQWAVEKVQLTQMPPEQRQALEGRREAERRARELEKQSGQSMQELQQTQSEHLRQMLDLVLERQDYNAAAQAYDARRGKEGAFKELVIQIGKSEHALNQKSITPLEAAQKALELIGEQPKAPEKVAAPQSQVTPTTPQRKTLPNLTGTGTKTGTAPGKAPMRSLDDLKRAYDTISAQK